VIVPEEGWTLLAIAKESWNSSGLTSSRENVGGSPAAFVQVMVSGPEEVGCVEIGE
jgi:hypothetical protein